MKMKLIAACSVLGLLAACDQPADADNFEVTRRIVLYNGITDTYMLTIEGLCSLGSAAAWKRSATGFTWYSKPARPGELTVTCQTGPKEFKRHFLGLSDNITYFDEHLDPTDVSTFHYSVVFRPQSIIPDVKR